MHEKQIVLEGRGIVKTYRGRWGTRPETVLSGVSLRLFQGETLGLMGPSGCGKSTLARIFLRLIPLDEGAVFFQGQEITRLHGRALLPFRQQVQLISQRPETCFDPHWTLGKSLLEPLAIFGLRTDGAARAAELLEQVKLSGELLSRYPHQVSGGEIQRLALVRALLLRPKVLVLDEPTSMLDISVQAQVLQILREIREIHQLSCLFITHDHEAARYMCGRIQNLPARSADREQRIVSRL